jgi:hypothetical protein
MGTGRALLARGATGFALVELLLDLTVFAYGDKFFGFPGEKYLPRWSPGISSLIDSSSPDISITSVLKISFNSKIFTTYHLPLLNFL